MIDFSNLSSTQISDLIDLWIVRRNAERDRNIMKRRLIDGRTFDALAAEFEMSRNGVQNVVYRRSAQLFLKK